MAQIWVIADQAERAFELLAKARQLASAEDKVVCFVAGDDAVGNEAISFGADSSVLIPIPEGGMWEGYAAAIAEKAKTDAPKAILISATRRGKDLGAQLAGMLDAPLVSDCKLLEIEGDKAVTERLLYGGLGVQRQESTSFPLLASFGPRSFDKPEADASRSGEVESLAAPDAGGVKVTGRIVKETEGVELGDADLVVGIGRGFDDESQISLAKDAAEALGAELACSRPIAEYFKWLPEDRYLGISGQQIKASLYLACGISGQVQHLYGIRDVKTIVAVNTDQNAPIFNLADYYVVGDVKEFLPAFAQAVKAAKG